MKILLSRHTSVCYGIRRAVRLVSRKLKEAPRGAVVSYGDLFGSRAAMDELKSKGLRVLDGIESIKNLSGEETVVLPVWGAAIEVMDVLRARKMRILNTTCPRDALTHKLAYRLAREGYGVIIVGDQGTTPAEALMSRVLKGRREQMEGLGEGEKRAFAGAVVDGLCGKEPDLRQVPEDVSHVAIIAQANVSMEAYGAVVSKAAVRFDEVRAYNTVCRSIAARFKEAVRMASSCDLLLIVGDENTETREMKYLCLRSGKTEVRLVTDAGDLPLGGENRQKAIGVVSSTSTPDWVLVKVVEELRRDCEAQVEESF